MTTRLYLNGNPPDVVPVNNGYWGSVSNTGTAARLTALKENVAFSSYGIGDFMDLTMEDIAIYRAVSPPLLSGLTISGTVKMQAAAYYSGEQPFTKCDDVVEIYVVSNDGQTVRGTLWSKWPAKGTWFNHGFQRNKTFADGDALTPVVAQAGDRIVVKWGARVTCGHMTGWRYVSGPDGWYWEEYSYGDGSVVSRVGDPTGTSEYPENELETNDLVPWVEFSLTLPFVDMAASAGVATITCTAPAATGVRGTAVEDITEALALNYRDGKWSTWRLPAKMVAACAISGVPYFIDDTGYVWWQDADNPTYADNGTTYQLTLDLPWFALAEPGGRFRFYELQLVGHRKKSMQITVRFAYDFDAGWPGNADADTIVWDKNDAVGAFGDDAYLDSTLVASAYEGQAMIARFAGTRQSVRAVRARIEIAPDDESEDFTLSAIVLVVGLKPGHRRAINIGVPPS